MTDGLLATGDENLSENSVCYAGAGVMLTGLFRQTASAEYPERRQLQGFNLQFTAA